jgi:hypothetical protein
LHHNVARLSFGMEGGYRRFGAIDVENQLQCSAQDAVIQSDPPWVQRKIDRRLVIIGFKGGLVSVVSLILLVWLHLRGATIMPVAAWLALIFTSYEIPSLQRSSCNSVATSP